MSVDGFCFPLALQYPEKRTNVFLKLDNGSLITDRYLMITTVKDLAGYKYRCTTLPGFYQTRNNVADNNALGLTSSSSPVTITYTQLLMSNHLPGWN